MSKTVRNTTTETTTTDRSGGQILPSADLIVYRFDQIDDQLRQTNHKLDNMTASFLTKEESAAIKLENVQRQRDFDLRLITLEKDVKSLVGTDNRQQGSIDTSRRLITYGLTLLGIAIAALATYLGLHK